MGEKEGVSKRDLSDKICHTYAIMMNLGPVTPEDPKSNT